MIVPGRIGGYSSEMDMDRKRVQLLVLFTFVMTFVVAVTGTTANTTTSRNATTIDSAIFDNPTTLPPPDPPATDFVYAVKDPETGVTCITVAITISIKANYTSTGYDIKEAFLKIPPTAKVRGTCRGEAPTMELIWAEDSTLEGTLNRITLMIGSKHITYSFDVIVFELYIDEKNFPDAIQEGKRFECEMRGPDEFSASKTNRLYRCEPETTASTVEVDITISGLALARIIRGESVSTTIEENGASGADMTQWSGYLLLAAKIFIFLKLGHQGI